MVGGVSCEFLTERIDGPCEIIRLDRGGAQSLHRIPAFGDRFGSLLNALSSCSFASTGRSGSNSETISNRSSNPWKL